MITVRNLSYQERALWGTCPVCGAQNGQPCKEKTNGPDIDQAIGAHVARLIMAPQVVAEDQP